MEIIVKRKRNGVAIYDAVVIGERRLSELNLHGAIDVDVRELGKRSIKRIPTAIALVPCVGGKSWQIVPRKEAKKYYGHCYVMVGKKIRHIGGKVRSDNIEEAIRLFEEEEYGTPMCKMSAEQIFYGCMGRRTTKKSHISGSQKPNPDMYEGVGTMGNIIVTKRFPNSKLTCVTRAQKY